MFGEDTRAKKLHKTVENINPDSDKDVHKLDAVVKDVFDLTGTLFTSWTLNRQWQLTQDGLGSQGGYN